MDESPVHRHLSRAYKATTSATSCPSLRTSSNGIEFTEERNRNQLTASLPHNSSGSTSLFQAVRLPPPASAPMNAKQPPYRSLSSLSNGSSLGSTSLGSIHERLKEFQTCSSPNWNGIQGMNGPIVLSERDNPNSLSRMGSLRDLREPNQQYVPSSLSSSVNSMTSLSASFTPSSVGDRMSELCSDSSTRWKRKMAACRLRVQTTSVPEDPYELQEIEAEFDQMRLIMRERGIDPKVDPEAFLPENYQKNRYHDVLPYKETRVKLDGSDDGISSYINANYVYDRQNKAQKYICCQAPLPKTFDDFWRMVWEKDCPVIVMLTKLEERNTIKAHVYWPEPGSRLQYGPYMVTHLRTTTHKKRETEGGRPRHYGIFGKRLPPKGAEAGIGPTRSPHPTNLNTPTNPNPFDDVPAGGTLSHFGGNGPFPQWNMTSVPPSTPIASPTPALHNVQNSLIVVRKFTIEDVRRPGVTKEVIQLHYTEWPDFGVPDTTEQMSDLIRELDIRKKGLDDPIIVHCSAGIGRTGTFLAIHMALQQVATSASPSIDVFETVLNLRVQRTGMVQSKDQYKFVYITIKDMLMRKYDRIQIKNYRRDFFNLTHHTKTDHIRNFIEKVPKNRPRRSASEPILHRKWEKLIEEEELPLRLEEM
ncbi:hypothetical protein PROFUN_06615 [Planoprotostelium fungivorum]|uniref:Uncharacterized protein n=1 Tax=Planoprotostelium fungivorum TaxID=1890364 RepID=A0A2P6MST1_9EUKA|nr:hypothetical protein PROFUN_06615 [Planoprotostelium fungivorum]